MMYSKYEIGSRIQELRIARGLTQEALAEELDLSTVFIAKIEIGAKGCSIESLVKIAELFAVSLDFLVMGKRQCYSIADDLDKVLGILSEMRQKI